MKREKEVAKMTAFTTQEERNIRMMSGSYGGVNRGDVSSGEVISKTGSLLLTILHDFTGVKRISHFRRQSAKGVNEGHRQCAKSGRRKKAVVP